jgi:hypothetical protein
MWARRRKMNVTGMTVGGVADHQNVKIVASGREKLRNQARNDVVSLLHRVS